MSDREIAALAEAIIRHFRWLHDQAELREAKRFRRKFWRAEAA